MPTPNRVKTRLRERAELKPIEIPQLTTAERENSDKSAVLSMLWLHYAKRWPFEAFNGSVFERNFGKDPVTALKAAAELYDKETIMRWMQDQERLANAV